MGNTPDLSHPLAEFAAGIRFADLPHDAVDAAKKSLLDTLGVMLGASGMEPAVRPIIELVADAGGKEEARILGFGGRVPAAAAAFANGTLAHGLDYDSQTPWGAHPDSSLIPALLALADRQGNVTGEELITAIAIGQELFIRLRCNVGWKMDWNLSSVVGIYSGVAACGSLLGLSAEQIAHAMGIASLNAGGTMQQIFGTGSNLRGLYAGFIAQNAVNATLLAQNGMLGMEDLFEGEAGIFKVYFHGDYNREKILADLGGTFLSAGMTYKYWPAVGNAHTYIHAAIELAREHGLKPEEIKEVRVYVGDFAERMVKPIDERKKPNTIMDAKFSLPFTVALALIKGRMKISDFSTDSLNDPRVLALADKVEPVFDPNFNWNLKLPAGKVEVTTHDGRRLERDGSAVPGTPERPMTWEELNEKFSDCAHASTAHMATETITRAQSLIRSLEHCDEVTRLLELTS
ncbi:MmgE/PrpD family protein [Pseudarthrobacter phenanthrenivorans]|uniref:MmgE/PrpD family protein n=1 Tax=Pseudarthrobacter phenanthrenivorans TaxID=361575 RepID=A0A0B4DLM3_PSEPS|nr:MmgE/PrpD family protein [Pseudarthrobacter phenanthrenivorans]KIC65290.1 MmgE/PrpD family protein [Pseudarthrobacter phenanthrenivorans]